MVISSIHESTNQAQSSEFSPQGGTPRLAVLVSGRGSNLQALYESARACGFALDWLVIANRSDSYGLKWARGQGLETDLLVHADCSSREEFDLKLAGRLNQFQPTLVVLAGFMRILTPAFFQSFRGLLINIHPSLLPAYPGLHTHARALQDGVVIHGATVHSVTPELDQGPILAQAVVRVLPQDSEDSLGARVLEMEHRLLPMVTWALLRGDLQLVNHRWSLLKSQTDLPSDIQFSSCLLHPQLSVSPG